jgi:putative two-component system response regulator
MAESIALTHHERWDGSGYPADLRGEAIPLATRICAVCDVFDALLSTRRYKRGWSMEEAIAELLAQRGRHFDPALVDAFVAMAPGIEEDWDADAREAPGIGVLTIDQSTPAGASERIHSRRTSPPARA